MLEEAIAVIRLLWQGGLQSHRGRHYVVETARVYSLPKTRPPIMIAVGGEKSAELAGRIGDGMVGTSPDVESLNAFERAGGGRKPRFGELKVCGTGTSYTKDGQLHGWVLSPLTPEGASTARALDAETHQPAQRGTRQTLQALREAQQTESQGLRGAPLLDRDSERLLKLLVQPPW